MSIKTIAESKAIKGKNEQVTSVVSEYTAMFDESKGGGIEVRQEKYMKMVNNFYNMVTDIYEYGWGQSFHFAPRNKSESFDMSIVRHEHYMALKLNLKKGMRIMDLGCGVGGPGRAIARFSGASVIGINNNEYQLQRCRDTLQREGPKDLCSYVKSDYMNLPFEDSSIDGGIQVEAFAHAPDRFKLCKELFRVMKPGSCFAGYDWIITPKHNPNNPEHVRVKKAIELGNSLPDLPTIEHVLETIRAAGFEVLETEDKADTYNQHTDYTWYDALEASYSFQGFKHTYLGRWVTSQLIWGMEIVRLAPKGTLQIQTLLSDVAVELVKGGRMGTFSPMFFYVIRKPEKSK